MDTDIVQGDEGHHTDDEGETPAQFICLHDVCYIKVVYRSLVTEF